MRLMCSQQSSYFSPKHCFGSVTFWYGYESGSCSFGFQEKYFFALLFKGTVHFHQSFYKEVTK
jgi:hypothetical protein